jgi:molecular chaperone DnaK
VSAKDLGTSKEQKITITASSGLAKDEVDRMVQEASSHADEDKKRREEIETRNHADQAVYASERMLKDTGDKLSPADRQSIESAMDELKKAIEKNDVEDIKRKMDALNQAQHRAAESLYRQTQQGGSPGAETAPGPEGRAEGGRQSSEGGDVIDAEVVDEERK